MGKIIGIDLGTTNSCVAVMEGGQTVVIPNSEGGRTTPSVVAITKTGERLVGEAAKRQAVTNSDNTIMSIKRIMGTNKKVTMGGKEYAPQEISAMILQKLKADAEAYLGEKVTEAVITVPAYFSENERQATVDAGKIAGFDVKRIINEPTAAALAYGLDEESYQKTLVYDLGGGTFDVSIIALGDGVVEVKASTGERQLGGDDFDERIMKYIVEEFKKTEGIDLSKDKMAMQRIKEAAEKAKKELSSVTQTNINMPFITANQDGPKHLDMNLTRAKFDELTHDLVEKTKNPVLDALKSSNLKSDQLDKVLLVGGSTRIPAVQDLVKNLTGKEPFKGINPDECVAVGAAIQGAKLAGDAAASGIVLVDVTPLSLGIETLGGINSIVVERNTTVPTSKSQIFSTAADNQPAVTIMVVQGERKFAKDNKIIGNFTLDGIPPAPRGIPQIEVTFDIDTNGMVTVSAKDKATGKEQKITITASNAMSKEDVEKAINEAKQHEADDKKRKDIVDTKNQADSVVFQTEKAMSDLGDKISGDDKASIEAEIGRLKSSAETLNPETSSESDVEQVRKDMEALGKVTNEIFSKAYQQGGPTEGDNGGGDNGSSENPGGDSFEGDYREV